MRLIDILYSNFIQRLTGGATDQSGSVPMAFRIGGAASYTGERGVDQGSNAGYIPHPYKFHGLEISPNQNVPRVTPESQAALSALISRVSLHKISGF